MVLRLPLRGGPDAKSSSGAVPCAADRRSAPWSSLSRCRSDPCTHQRTSKHRQCSSDRVLAVRGWRETTYHGGEPCLASGCTAVSNEQRSGLMALAHKTRQFIQRGAAPTCTGRRWRGTESGARRIVQNKREILQHTPAQVNRGATQRVQHHHTTRTSSIHRSPVPRAVAVSGVGEGAGEPLPVLARGSDPEPASTPNGGDMPMSRSVSPSA